MIKCSLCRGELIEQVGTFVHEENGEVWVIRHVPMFVCQQCGEKEYSQETTHRILSFVEQPPRPVEILHVPAYELT
jgi:YgiT-type zinc finger domain-containing protein